MSEHNQQFDSHIQWINKAPSWLTRHPKHNVITYRALCIDSAGNICRNGGDFKDAVYPVRYWWPDQPIKELVVQQNSTCFVCKEIYPTTELTEKRCPGCWDDVQSQLGLRGPIYPCIITKVGAGKIHPQDIIIEIIKKPNQPDGKFIIDYVTQSRRKGFCFIKISEYENMTTLFEAGELTVNKFSDFQ